MIGGKEISVVGFSISGDKREVRLVFLTSAEARCYRGGEDAGEGVFRLEQAGDLGVSFSDYTFRRPINGMVFALDLVDFLGGLETMSFLPDGIFSKTVDPAVAAIFARLFGECAQKPATIAGRSRWALNHLCDIGEIAAIDSNAEDGAAVAVLGDKSAGFFTIVVLDLRTGATLHTCGPVRLPGVPTVVVSTRDGGTCAVGFDAPREGLEGQTGGMLICTFGRAGGKIEVSPFGAKHAFFADCGLVLVSGNDARALEIRG